MAISKKISIQSIIVILLLRLISLHVTSAQNSARDVINAHNIERTAVGVPPAQWNDTVAAFAMDYATKYRAKDCAMEHSTLPFGENIAAGGPDFSIVDAVKGFAAEKKFYDKGTKGCKGGECGHYANMIAHDSTQIGCARVKCKGQGGDGIFVGCSYWGPGWICPIVQPGDPRAYTQAGTNY
ncbi:hypothetical protein Leryth_021872 [Lithospermum erythrorhizon]|uniref:Defense/immunity protein n=1 Tax=Lithospermum erythrorhizon TaxID=34254 RepID=A0AAV3QPM1_LITER|nr:hypothetical protein Leryth_021872 [Lithospermum erythrorhizon]